MPFGVALLCLRFKGGQLLRQFESICETASVIVDHEKYKHQQDKRYKNALNKCSNFRKEKNPFLECALSDRSEIFPMCSVESYRFKNRFDHHYVYGIA